ncbi:MAG: hypothetical protein ACK5O3_16990 [Burkholderiales bacterium]
MRVLAIDVGHGHLKMIRRVSEGAYTTHSFPAFAVPVAAGNSASAVMQASLKLTEVDVDGQRFRAGPDIELAIPPGANRNRDDNYSKSPAYLALLKTALHKAGMREIDLLVVGLPMTTLASNREHLRSVLEGTHEVPAFEGERGSSTETVTVRVRKVVVLAQALGALFAAAAQVPDIESERVLTLDLGWHTLDVLVSQGLRVFAERVGAIPGGVAGYIDQLQKSVAAEIQQQRPDLSGHIVVPASIYEQAMQKPAGKRFVSLGPGRFDIDQHRAMAQQNLAQTLEAAAPIIHSANDISCIVLAGGGAELLVDVVKKQFPAIARVITLSNPQFAVALGFLLFGERRLAGERKEQLSAVA